MRTIQAARPACLRAAAPSAQHFVQIRTGNAGRAPCKRLAAVACRAHAEYKELLGTLQELSDDALAEWAVAHRERLTLHFLSWLSEEELAAEASHPVRQQQLWELGSKLMALREGLSPVGNEVLQEELRAAALRCSGGSTTGSSSEGDEQGHGSSGGSGGGASLEQRRQDAQQQQAAAATAALATPAFGSAVQAVAALGLSPEGLVLFEQQAAALEAVVGTSRARSLTQVIGRAKVQDQRQVQRMAEADSATRILDVLLSVHDRDERAAMLPDAFTPPGSTAAVDDDASYFSPDEDQLYTTPLRLLQAIDLYLARLQGGGPAARGAPELMGGGLRLTIGELQSSLTDLREDVEMYWQAGEGDAC